MAENANYEKIGCRNNNNNKNNKNNKEDFR